MSILRRYYIRADYRARLVAVFPFVTAAQLMRFDDLVRSDRLLADDGTPHLELEAWSAAVLRGGPDGGAVPVTANGDVPPTLGGQVIAAVSA